MNRSFKSLAAGAAIATLAAAPAWLTAQEAQQPPETQQPPAAGAQPEAQQPAQGLYSKRIQEITGKEVANVNGDTLGEIEQVVRGTDDDRLYVVISVGGFLGIGDKQVALPVDDLQLSEDRLVLTTNLDEDALKQQADAYEAAQYQPVTEDMTLAEARGGAQAAAGGAEQLPSFASLDQNGDGTISREEAREAAALERNWEQADQDQDGQLTESEFSAFEQMHTGGQQPGAQPRGEPGMQQQPGSGMGDSAPGQTEQMQTQPEGESPQSR